MRSRLVSSVTALLAGTGVALGQAPAAPVQSHPAAAQATLPSASPAAAPNSYAPAGPAVAYGAVPGPNATVVGSPGDALVVGGSDMPGEGPRQADLDEPIATPTRLYGRAEYLLWNVPPAPLPPNQVIIPFSTTGIPSFQSSFNFSTDGLPIGDLSGGRVTAGYWIDPGCLALEANFFEFERKSTPFAATATADLPANFTATITSTVINIILGVPVSSTSTFTTQTTFPIELKTNASGAATVKEFWGGEANARAKQCYIGPFSYDLLAGLRTIQFAEDFNLNESIQLTAGQPITGTGTTPPPLTSAPGIASLANITTFDKISTRNQFYGAQVGLSFEWCLGHRVSVTGFGKVAAGGLYEVVNIEGATVSQSFRVVSTAPTINPTTGAVIAQGTVTNVGTPTTSTLPGGLLTPGVGNFHLTRTHATVIPEGNITLGYHLTPGIRAFVGYNILYFEELVRPGNQIGFNTSSANITILGQSQQITVVQPGFQAGFSEARFDGLNAGLEFRY